MRVELLGELRVFDDDGAQIEIRGAKLRGLLALLCLAPGQVVPGDQLVDALWGAEPPDGVRNGLQALVSRLRRALGTDVVKARAPGYLVDLPAASVDVLRG